MIGPTGVWTGSVHQGADEYELYTLVKENGEWKIDQQEIVEKSEQSKWFTKKAS